MQLLKNLCSKCCDWFHGCCTITSCPRPSPEPPPPPMEKWNLEPRKVMLPKRGDFLSRKSARSAACKVQPSGKACKSGTVNFSHFIYPWDSASCFHMSFSLQTELMFFGTWAVSLSSLPPSLPGFVSIISKVIRSLERMERGWSKVVKFLKTWF